MVKIKCLTGASCSARVTAMSEPIEHPKMKAVIVLPPRTMSKKDMQKLNDNYMIVVEAKDPSLVRFIEPPPMGYTAQQNAAIQLCRLLFSRQFQNTTWNRRELSEKFVDIILTGTPLGESPVTPVAPVKK